MPRPYQPALLRLEETAELIAPQPKAHICRALVEGRIKFRVLIDKSDHWYGGQWVGHGTGIGVRVPSDLQPAALDWAPSRPLGHWEVGVDVPYSEESWRLDSYVPRAVARLELLRADVEEVFGIAEQPALEQPAHEPGVEAFARRSGRRGPRPVQRERVKAAMLKDIRDGRFTAQELRDMPEESMAAEYEASRDICRSARQEVCDSL